MHSHSGNKVSILDSGFESFLFASNLQLSCSGGKKEEEEKEEKGDKDTKLVPR